MSTGADHWQFLPTLDRITDEPPRKGAMTVSRIVMALVAVLIAWGFLGQLDVVVVAEGRLVPESYVKIVQPAEAGVVRDILVREGDYVEAGQILIRMDDTLSSADTRALTQTLAGKKLELRRMEAELNGKPFVAVAGDDMMLYREAKARFDANRAAWADSIGSARGQRERAAGERAAAAQEQAKLEQLVPVYRAELAAMESLRGKGYVSELEYNARKRAVIESEQSLQVQHARVSALMAAERQAERELSNASTRYRADLERERTALLSEVRQLEQQATKQQHRNAGLELRAPQAGIVNDLATHTPGTVVAPGTVMLSLVPDAERLVAEVAIRNEDIGELRPGLPVQLKVAAYRFQKYGMLGGTVQHISPDAGAGESGAGRTDNAAALTYRALVSIERTGDGEIDRQLLSAGMRVTAEIDVGTRTPLQYLLDPVRGTASSAGRER